MSTKCRLVALLSLAALGIACLMAPSVSAAETSACGPKCVDIKTGPHAVHGQQIVVADGRGGLHSVLGGASDCVGCAWRIVPECAYHPSSSGGDNACSNATSGYVCTTPAGQPGVPYRTFFSQAPPAWQRTGTICLGAKEKPLSLDAILAKVRVLADQLVPPSSRLIVQPGGGMALVNLPTLMRADGAQTAAKDFFVDVGAPIRVAVAARSTAWRWQVDGSTVLSTDFPGRPYDSAHSPRVDPGYYASYTFDRLGVYRLSVTVDWAATASIAGIGTIAIDGAIPRTSPAVAVQVKEARARLES